MQLFATSVLAALTPVLWSCADAVQVYALVDREGTGAHVQLHELLTGQNQPNGVAWHNNSLYVAEVGQITRYDNPDAFALAGKVRQDICALCMKQDCMLWLALQGPSPVRQGASPSSPYLQLLAMTQWVQLLQALPKGHVISRAMPANQTDHQVHVIGVGPDNLLYFNQGAET